MDFATSPGSAQIQNEDGVEIIETLCVDFRDRLLVALSSTCQSDFTEAKKIVEERLRDLLDTTSSLSSAEVTYHGPKTSTPLCSPGVPEENVSAVSIDVGLDEPMLDCSQSTPSGTGGAVDPKPQDLGTNETAVGDLAWADLFAADAQNTSHISGSCLQDSSLGVASMSSPTQIDWASLNSNFPNTQEDLAFFGGEPNLDDWVSNMTWSSMESRSSPSDGHLAGDTLPPSHMHLDPTSPAGRSITPMSSVTPMSSATPMSSDTNARSTPYFGRSSPTPSNPTLRTTPSDGRSSPTQSPSPSSYSSAFESCSSVHAPAAANSLQRNPRKQISRRTTDASPRDQQIRSRVGGPISLDLSVEYALGRFSDAERVFETFRQRLSVDRKHLSSLLMRLFYAVGSPDALRQLQDALDLARKNYMIPACHGANDLATTVSVLDQLDSTTTLSHILRRYHLVRLLDHRSKLESNYNAARVAAKGTKRRLKYDCAMIEVMKRGGEAAFDADARSARVKQLKYRPKSQALNDLMRTLYPDLRPDPEGSISTDGCEYKRKLTKLKNRLSCARNWYQFEKEFPGAILALIPCGAGELSISIDQAEKLPSDVLRIFLDYLKEQRGTFLSKLSQALSTNVYEILTRRDATKKYKLEETDENSVEDCLYDNDVLLELCKLV